jgi:hypothetical protein
MRANAERVEVVRVCANDCKPLTPKQRVYCSDACKQLVRLWRLKMSLVTAVRR